MAFTIGPRSLASCLVSRVGVALALGFCIVVALHAFLADGGARQTAMDVSVDRWAALWRQVQGKTRGIVLDVRGRVLGARKADLAGKAHLPAKADMDACFDQKPLKKRKKLQNLRRHEKDVALVYLRAAKTGSSTLVTSVLDQASDTCPTIAFMTCHDVTKASLPQRYRNVTTFSILREPCERFTSAVSQLNRHLKKIGGPGNWTALEYARFLLRRKATQESHVFPHHFLPQRAYVGHVGVDSEIGCLPTMWSDIERIFAKHGADCTLPRHANVNVQSHEPPSPAICELVHQLYPEDFLLWKYHCAGRSGN